MKIFLQGHEYKYEIENIVRLFFINERIEFIEDDTNVEIEKDFIISRLTCDGNWIAADTVVSIHGITKEEKIRQRYDGIIPSVEFTKYCKSLVKLSLYRASKQLMQLDIPWGTLTGIRPTKIVHALMEDRKSDDYIQTILTEQYDVSNEKIQLAIEVAKKERKILKESQPDNIALYIGIPFCPTRCLYCSFVSNSVQRAQRFIEPYIEALKKEIRRTADIIKDMRWNIESVYIGGGTPTVLQSSQLDQLLYELNNDMDLTGIKEFTIEAGRPDTIDKEKLYVIKKYPVSRLSINPQTMNLDTLRTIGRCHTPEDIVHSFNLARELGFDNINMDVIAGLPGESVDMYKNTLVQVQGLNPENITVHTMSIKRASRLYEKIDEYTITHGKEVEEMLSYTQKFMKDYNMYPYYLYRQKNILGNQENVGYCKKDRECIYNIQIMEEKQTILALGCGGVTKMVDINENHIERIFNVKDVEEYIHRIDEMLERKNRIYDYFNVR